MGAIPKQENLKKIHIPPTVEKIENWAIDISELQELYIFNRNLINICKSQSLYGSSICQQACILYVPVKSKKYPQNHQFIKDIKCVLKGTYLNYDFVEDDPLKEEYIPF